MVRVEKGALAYYKIVHNGEAEPKSDFHGVFAIVLTLMKAIDNDGWYCLKFLLKEPEYRIKSRKFYYFKNGERVERPDSYAWDWTVINQWRGPGDALMNELLFQ